MKNNSLIRLTNQAPVRKIKAIVKTSSSMSLAGVDNDINHLWQMYQSQLQRNGELLAIIDRQQQFIQQVISQGALNLITPPPAPEILPAPIALPLPEFKELSIDVLNEHVAHLDALFWNEIKRLDGKHGIIKFLYTLKQTGGIAYPEQLFEKCKMGKSTGFRHSAFLQRKHFIKTVGGKYDTRYKISHWGSKFLEGTLQKGYDQPIQSYHIEEEGIKAWEPYLNLTV